jgi:hypothetical protein
LVIDEIVARSATAAVVLTVITAYPTGAHLNVLLIGQEGVSFDGLGMPPGVAARMQEQFGGSFIDPDPFELSVAYDDGRVARVFDWGTDEPQAPPVLSMEGAGGGGGFKFVYWLHPLPAEGDLELRCRWGSQGLADSRRRIDGQALRATAARARPIWP